MCKYWRTTIRKKNVLKVFFFLNKTNTSFWMFYSEQTVSLTMEIVTVIVLLSKNEPLQELTHEGLQNTWGQQQCKLMLL